jgi:hypothetical protein
MSQLETTLKFLRDALFNYEDFGGEFISTQTTRCPSTTDERKGKHIDPASTVSSEDDLDQDGRRPVSRPLDDIPRDSALDTTDVWYDDWDAEFGQILGQQFLDPGWLQ